MQLKTYFDFVRNLNKQCVRVKMLGRRQCVHFSKTFHTPSTLKALQHIDELVDQGEIFKAGNSTTVSRTTIDGKDVVIKRFNSNSISQGIRQLFKVSKAYNNWFMAHWLSHNNILTPKPLAVVELRLGLLWQRSYYICEYFPGTELSQCIKHPERSVMPENALKQCIQLLFNSMRAARVSHGDFKASNLICVQSGIALIDLDHACFHFFGIMLNYRLNRDNKRLLRNF